MNNECKKDTQKHSPAKHILHMVICCALPIVLILSLPLIASYNSGVAKVLGFIAPFLCPIMMGGMMFMMIGRNKSRH